MIYKDNIKKYIQNATKRYVFDTTAQNVQNWNEFIYIQSGATQTDTGFSLSAANGDIDLRQWVNGCPIGNNINGGVTIAFHADLPTSNHGKIYYIFSGSQGQAQNNPFFGFESSFSGQYKIIKNLAQPNQQGTPFTDMPFSNSIDVILYINPISYELYTNGKKLGTFSVDVNLSNRWYFGFSSYYSSGSATSATITKMQILKGKAIKGA